MDIKKKEFLLKQVQDYTHKLDVGCDLLEDPINCMEFRSWIEKDKLIICVLDREDVDDFVSLTITVNDDGTFTVVDIDESKPMQLTKANLNALINKKAKAIKEVNKERADMGESVKVDVNLPVVSQVYVRKGSNREDYEDFVIVNEVGNGKVSFSNPFDDWFELSVDAFNKKYVKGKKPDYEMFEEGQDIQLVEVNGKEYPVVSQGRDAYICLDEDGNKFRVMKDSINLFEGATSRGPWDMTLSFIKESIKDANSDLHKLFNKVCGGNSKEFMGNLIATVIEGKYEVCYEFFTYTDRIGVSARLSRNGKQVDTFTVWKDKDSGKSNTSLFRGVDKFITDGVSKLNVKIDDIKSKDKSSSSKKSTLVGKKIYNKYFDTTGEVVAVDYENKEIKIKDSGGKLMTVDFDDIMIGTENDWRMSAKSRTTINF